MQFSFLMNLLELQLPNWYETIHLFCFRARKMAIRFNTFFTYQNAADGCIIVHLKTKPLFSLTLLLSALFSESAKMTEILVQIAALC